MLRLSKKSDYALIAMAHLAARPDGNGSSSAREISETYSIPLELLAYHYASSRGLTMLGFDDESRRSLNYHQIFGE